jgi:protease-4
MSLDPDVLIDRRSLKRKLSAWRVAAVVAVVLAAIAGLAAAGAFKGVTAATEPQIARISIAGFISPDRKLLDLFDQVGKSDAVKGVILEIDSGGGASVGGEAIYEAARKTALTASIGVLAEWPDVSKLLDTIGVKFDAVRSSPIKGLPDTVTPSPPELKPMLNLAIQATYKYFVDLVADRRHMSMDEVKPLADGRVVTGTQAKELKLIDEVGEESVAVTWLESERHVAANLPIRDWKPKTNDLSFFSTQALAEEITRGILRATGFDRDIQAFHPLDGIQSVWHPVANDNTKTSEGIVR